MSWYNIFKNAEDLEVSKAKIFELETEAQEAKDFRLAISNKAKEPGEIAKIIKIERRTLSKPLIYKTNNISSYRVGRKGINTTFQGPVYDLGEIARAIDVEPYINQSVRKHREQILKEGFSFTGSDEEMINYVNQRLFEIELVSGTTFNSVIREFCTNLVAYATAFLVLKRDGNKSSGRATRLYGKRLEPIAAIYPLDPTTVSVALNKYGHPVKWKQTVVNAYGKDDTVVFDASDIIVATMDKKSGFIFGTPYILPTLDDVRSLRRLEEITEVIAHKHAFGLVHWKVGTDTQPAQILDDGSDEISLVRSEIQNMPSEGGVVTSHRVEANVLAAGEQVLDMDKNLTYFEKRVMGGLRLSELDLGRGEVSKSSAATVSQGLQDSAKDFQSVIEDVISMQLVMPLLHEGGFNVTKENNVQFIFEMINREEQRAREAHGNDMWLSNGITCSEFRKDFLGKEPLSEEEMKDTNKSMDHENAKELQKMAAAEAAAKASATAKKTSTATKNKSSNKTRPTNQSGKKATKTRVTANNNFQSELLIYEANQLSVLEDCKNLVHNFIKRHGSGVAASGDPLDTTTKEDELNSILRTFDIASTVNARQVLEPIIDIGIDNCMEDMSIIGSYRIPKKLIDRLFKNFISKSFQHTGDICRNLINNNNILAGIDNSSSPVTAVNSIFDELEREIKTITHKHMDIAYRFGFTRAAKNHGYKTIILRPDDAGTCTACSEAGDLEVSIINKDIPITTILNTHSICDFAITLGSK